LYVNTRLPKPAPISDFKILLKNKYENNGPRNINGHIYKTLSIIFHPKPALANIPDINSIG
jgi:hypothetical protein